MTKRKDPKDFLKMGRKSLYKPEFCELLINHMRQGFSFMSFGGLPEVGVWAECLYDWVKKYPDFANAKKRGELSCLHWWEKVGNARVLGKIKDGCLGTYVFNMKNRFGWRDAKKELNELKKEEQYQIDFSEFDQA